MKAAEWVDRVKVSKGFESDYRAAKELGISRGGLSQIRTGDTSTLRDETALRVAHFLDIDPAIVLVDQARERARDDATRTAWSGVLQRLGGVAAGVLVAAGVSASVLADVAALCIMSSPRQAPRASKPGRRRPVMAAMARTLAGCA